MGLNSNFMLYNIWNNNMYLMNSFQHQYIVSLNSINKNIYFKLFVIFCHGFKEYQNVVIY